MNIYAVNIEAAPSKSTLLALMSCIPQAKRKKLLAYKRKEDYYRSLAAELLIRVLIHDLTGQSNHHIQFSYNSYGKPYLANDSIKFNLSHSGNWVVCAIDALPVGIDIEKIEEIDTSIAKRFFSTQEWGSLVNLPQPNKLHYFYNIWTLKESYVKNVGLGLSIPLHLISFTINEEEIRFINEHTNETRYFKQYDIDHQYKLSVCGFNDCFPKQIFIRSFEQLCSDSFMLSTFNE